MLAGDVNIIDFTFCLDVVNEDQIKVTFTHATTPGLEHRFENMCFRYKVST